MQVGSKESWLALAPQHPALWAGPGNMFASCELAHSLTFCISYSIFRPTLLPQACEAQGQQACQEHAGSFCARAFSGPVRK